MQTITVQTTDHTQLVEVTDEVKAVVRAAGVDSGIVTIHVPHTTAAVTINENADPSVVHDILADLERLVPWQERYYRHTEGNSAAHLKSSLVGSTQTLIVEQGRLVLGRWQGIYLCEFDGPRTRQLHVAILPAV